MTEVSSGGRNYLPAKDLRWSIAKGLWGPTWIFLSPCKYRAYMQLLTQSGRLGMAFATSEVALNHFKHGAQKVKMKVLASILQTAKQASPGKAPGVSRPAAGENVFWKKPLQTITPLLKGCYIASHAASLPSQALPASPGCRI